MHADNHKIPQLEAVYLNRYAYPSAVGMCAVAGIKDPRLDALFAKHPWLLIDSDADAHMGERKRLSPIGVGNAVIRELDEKPPFTVIGDWSIYVHAGVTTEEAIEWVSNQVVSVLLEMYEEMGPH